VRNMVRHTKPYIDGEEIAMERGWGERVSFFLSRGSLAVVSESLLLRGSMQPSTEAAKRL
jgi:hypothetical protein